MSRPGAAPRTAIALRHVPFEDLGVLGPLLESRGYRISYLDAGIDSLDDSLDILDGIPGPPQPGAPAGPDLLVVLGGPVGVHQAGAYPFLAAEGRAIARRLHAGGPTLGICLGAQLMAAASGARVAPTGRTEIGYAPLTLTAAGRASVLAPLDGAPVLHWHGDQFDIPDGAERLAETPGFPNQAFSLGGHALGLQFHLEADYSRIESWLIGHAHELATAGIDPRGIRADAARFGPALAEAACAVMGRWLDAIEDAA